MAPIGFPIRVATCRESGVLPLPLTVGVIVIPPPALFFLNLVSFGFSAKALRFLTWQLLDLLEGSPTLWTIVIEIVVHSRLKTSLRKGSSTSPYLENFNLITNDGGPRYDIATHTLCPSPRFTSLMHKLAPEGTLSKYLFPALDSWNKILFQKARSLVKEVSPGINTVTHIITSILTFRFTGATIVQPCFKFR